MSIRSPRVGVGAEAALEAALVLGAARTRGPVGLGEEQALS